ncbi:uncharacterized protein C8Q71DRAFT_368342 [Rhodofomes roseus]|uniref:Uncharacterized protein n=1 Tax=Rhodofomes roseus TaxID=34475 RepID=A0ABQ8K196_9APHY|nr:uncharacterized protein C8Q71DRAFT_368342 [Rhodofomes roseus]KAH9830498.1 hypothetical protein C8Q71DRAFT_368342 [Rhodofomes roseus]
MPNGPTIPIGGIYAGLFSRRDGTFHWTVMVPLNDTVCEKFHATEDSNGWRYEHTPHTVVTSRTACVVVKIAQLNNLTIEYLDRLLSTIPMETLPADQGQQFTCRIWFREAIRRLHKAGVLQCPSVNNLEFELKDQASSHYMNLERGATYKVLTSEYSK